MFDFIITGYRWIFLQMASVLGPGWAIVALSFICSALMAPLMKAVSGIVRRETDYQAVIDPQLEVIKAKYTSDIERHCCIQRLYSRYNYSPLSAVKKVLPLFVQIPFLLLTYYMLKGTAELNGVSFMFLGDLGRQDGLVRVPLDFIPRDLIGSNLLFINLLPILMTVVNLLTVFAARGFSSRERSQAVFIAVLFFALLYTAPSSLLLYWTLNNVITLVRTLADARGAGAVLLAKRLSHLFRLVYSVRNYSTKLFSGLTISLLVLSIYFYLLTEVSQGFSAGINAPLAYRILPFSVIGLLLCSAELHRRAKASHAVVWGVSLLLGIGLLIFLAWKYLNVFLLRGYDVSWAKSMAAWSVPIFLTPYLLQRPRIGFVDFLREFFLCLKTNWCFLTFPLILAVHYAYSSEVFVLPCQSLLLLAFYFCFPCVIFACLLVFMFRRWYEPDRLFRAAVGVGVGLYSLPMLACGTGLLAYDKNLIVRIAVLFIGMIVAAKAKPRKTIIVFSLILMCAVVLNACVRHINPSMSGVEDADFLRRMHHVVGETTCKKTNNIYLLIYDSYAHRSQMKGLRLQDDAVYDMLQQNGFTLYDAYSTGIDTISSMSAVFTLGGVRGESLKSTIGGDNIFSDFLRSAGYRTSYLLCGYTMPGRSERKPGHYYFPVPGDIKRPELVLLPCILRGSLSQSAEVFNSYTHAEWLAKFKFVISEFSESKNFIYAHSPFPEHGPNDEQFRRSDMEEWAAYSNRVAIANQEIAENMEIARRDPNAIIIVAADHGPHIMASEAGGIWDARHLIDRHGILLAIRWPKDYSQTLSLNCLQNVLLEVMIYLSGNNSLADLAVDGSTGRIGGSFGIPAGVVKNGIIQAGQRREKDLFEAAKSDFERNMR